MITNSLLAQPIAQAGTAQTSQPFAQLFNPAAATASPVTSTAPSSATAQQNSYPLDGLGAIGTALNQTAPISSAPIQLGPTDIPLVGTPNIDAGFPASPNIDAGFPASPGGTQQVQLAGLLQKLGTVGANAPQIPPSAFDEWGKSISSTGPTPMPVFGPTPVPPNYTPQSGMLGALGVRQESPVVAPSSIPSPPTAVSGAPGTAFMPSPQPPVKRPVFEPPRPLPQQQGFRHQRPRWGNALAPEARNAFANAVNSYNRTK